MLCPIARSFFRCRRFAHRSRAPSGRGRLVGSGSLRRLIALVSLAEFQGLGDLDVAPPKMTAQHHDESTGARKHRQRKQITADHVLLPDPWTQQSKSAPTLKFRLTRILPQLWLLGDNWSGRGGFFPTISARNRRGGIAGRGAGVAPRQGRCDVLRYEHCQLACRVPGATVLMAAASGKAAGMTQVRYAPSRGRGKLGLRVLTT